ncbi:MAG: HEAT repeat domain-containing protein, partial [Candidatus Korarchaeota archaeon]|nr:HEAT repeat domain-containing protein [Candidatus Korarchaeota archaeon]
MDVILKIIRECEEEGVCDERMASEMLRLAEAIEGYITKQLTKDALLNILREQLVDGVLGDLALLVLREICDRETIESLRNWAEDPNPEVRVAYLKCASKLFDEGEVPLELLRTFREDPSPKVREALVTSLSKNASKDDVFAFLAGMLRVEKRSSIRTKILTALSRVERDTKRERRRSILERLK